MSVAAPLRTGDVVLVRVHDTNECALSAFVVAPMTIGAGGNATMLLDIKLPDGHVVQRRVPSSDVHLPERRTAGISATPLGDDTSTGVGTHSQEARGGVEVCLCVFPCTRSSSDALGSSFLACARLTCSPSFSPPPPRDLTRRPWARTRTRSDVRAVLTAAYAHTIARSDT